MVKDNKALLKSIITNLSNVCENKAQQFVDEAYKKMKAACDSAKGIATQKQFKWFAKDGMKEKHVLGVLNKWSYVDYSVVVASINILNDFGCEKDFGQYAVKTAQFAHAPRPNTKVSLESPK